MKTNFMHTAILLDELVPQKTTKPSSSKISKKITKKIEATLESKAKELIENSATRLAGTNIEDETKKYLATLLNPAIKYCILFERYIKYHFTGDF